VANPPYLIKSRHQSIWYFRIAVPVDLRDVLDGRREIRRSTGENDPQLASIVAYSLVSKCKRLFREIRMAKKDKTEIRSNWVSVLLEGEDKVKFDVDFSGVASDEQRAHEVAAAQSLIHTYRTSNATPRGPITISSNLDSVEITQQRTQSMSELIDQFIQEEARRASDPTTGYSESSFREDRPRMLFWKSVFEGRTTSSISKKELSETSTWLTLLPKAFAKKGLSASQAVAIAKKGGDGNPIEASTYNHYARVLGAILKYGFRVDSFDNDWSGVIQRRNQRKGKTNDRMPYQLSELKTLFEPTTYANRVSGNRSTKSSFEARFWLPIVALYTGARLEELAQLTVENLQQADGIWCFDLNEKNLACDGIPQKLKNANSVRRIPVHPALVDAGLLNYRNQREASSGLKASLFNLEIRGADGKFGSPISKWFSNKNSSNGGFLEKSGLNTVVVVNGRKQALTFHGFRHTFVDGLRGKVFPDGTRVFDEDIAPLMGHIEGGGRGELQTSRYGQKKLSLKDAETLMSLLDYPGLKIPKWPDA